MLSGPGAEHLVIERGRMPQHIAVASALFRIGTDRLTKVHAHGQMVLVDVGVDLPIPAAENFQFVQHRDHRGIKVKGDAFAEQIEPDNLNVMRLVQGTAPGKCNTIRGFLRGRDRTWLDALEKSVLLHPRDKLVGMIGLLERVLGKDRLVAPIVTERIAQAQRLRKLTRLMDELVDPLQIVRTLRGTGS